MNKIQTALLAGALAMCSAASHAAIVLLQSHSPALSVGDEFLVDVILQDPFSGQFAGDQLLAFGFNLNYDSAGLSLMSKSVGPLWDDDTPFFDFDLAGSVFPSLSDDGSNTSILLGQLTFSALSAGSFTLGVGGSPLDDPSLGLIYLGGASDIFGQALLHVQPVQAVPVPAAGWLLGSGLIALFGMRRRRRN